MGYRDQGESDQQYRPEFLATEGLDRITASKDDRKRFAVP